MTGPLDVMRAIAALRLPSRAGARQKAVLWSLALRSNNGTGECWPSYRTIAADAGMSPSCAKETVRELVELGHLSKRHRAIDGSAEADSNVYRLHVVANADHVGRSDDQVGQDADHVVRGDDHVGRSTDDGGPGSGQQVVLTTPGGGPGSGQELLTELPKGTGFALTGDGTANGTGRSRKKPRTRAPGRDASPADVDAWCSKQGIPSPTVDSEAKNFLSHARENDRHCADWASAWDRWLEKAKTFARPARNSGHQGVPPGGSIWTPDGGDR